MLTSALTVLTKQCRKDAITRLAPGCAVRPTYRFRHGIAQRGSVTRPSAKNSGISKLLAGSVERRPVGAVLLVGDLARGVRPGHRVAPVVGHVRPDQLVPLGQPRIDRGTG